MKQKINIRLTLISLFAVITTSVVITIMYYGLFQTQVKKDLRQSAKILMETETFQSTYETLGNKIDNVHRFSSGNLRITWVDKDGTVLFDNDTDVTALGNHLDRPEIQQAFEDGDGETTRRSDTMNMNTYYYALLLENGTVLRVSTQARNISSVFITMLPAILAICLLIIIICTLIGHLLTRQLMRPIEEMAENLDEISVPAYKELEPFADKIRSQHEKILTAAKSRQDFTANVTHELKTPITAVSGYAELIENRLLDDDEEIHAAKQIRQNSDRLLSLITDIIELSELDHNELSRDFRNIDLFSIARKCVSDLRPLAEARSVTLTCTGVSAGIKADKDLIAEMIDNLVQNAIRYNKEGGSVRLSVTIEKGHPVLTVRDSGIGIPARHQERVFERFYRVDKSRSKETGGTGLGLAIVKHIAEIHNAEIEMDSVPGEGTAITVRF